MSILMSFLAVGVICAVGSLIYDLTKMTPGHITSLFVVIGCNLGCFGIYDILIDKFGYGLYLPITSFGYGLYLPITSFGNSLVNSAYEGFKTNGFFRLFSGMYVTTSAGIASTIIFSFFMALVCKPKD